MKETDGSLKRYFLIVGVLSALSAVSDISDISNLGDLSMLPIQFKLALYVPVAVRLLLGIGFVLAGLAVKKTLPTGGRGIKQLLLVSGVLLLADTGLIIWALGVEVGQRALITSAIGIAITIYLYASVTRLAREAATAASAPDVPAPRPTA